MEPTKIPFNRPWMTGEELQNIQEAHSNMHLAGDGPFTQKCHDFLEKLTDTERVLLTHSCTAALEMAALLLNLNPGDEVLMPSWTFVSTANAFALRGAVPVFVDIRDDTLNMNELLIEEAITPKTRAIVPVHYAGVSAEMDTILKVANRHGLAVVEDAAQGVMARYRGRALGGIGDLGTFSFHETKNVISGEGGALLVNRKDFELRAEIIREKGTNRSRFFRGEVDKYTWQDMGSSYLPGELIAAFLWAQLQKAQFITETRLGLWQYYHRELIELELLGLLRRPVVPVECEHNGHLYYIRLPSGVDRNLVLEGLKCRGIGVVFHYVPLHSSPAGLEFGRSHGDLPITDLVADQLLRLPLWVGMTPEQQDRVVVGLKEVLLRSSTGFR